MKRSKIRDILSKLILSVVLTIGLLGANDVFADKDWKWHDDDKKHFVLVHGAWHGSWAWYKMVPLLEARGHTVTLINLPSHGIDSSIPGLVTLADYTVAVTDVLDTVTDPVILVGHSMGGAVISAAAESRPNKIEKLVFLAAFLLRDGESMIQLAGMDTGSIAVQNLIVDPVTGTMDVPSSVWKDAFYNTTRAHDFTLASTLLKTNPLVPIITTMSLTPENFGSVRRFYIKTLKDNAITPWLQDEMIAASPCEKVYSIKGDHSPFFSRPLKLAWILYRIAHQ